MTTYPYGYRVKFCTGEEDDYKQYYINGMGLTTSYAEAARQLEEYFGNDLMEIDYLELFEESITIILPASVIETYKKTDFPDVDFAVEAAD